MAQALERLQEYLLHEIGRLGTGKPREQDRMHVSGKSLIELAEGVAVAMLGRSNERRR
jgi:hypothetical protein